MENVTFLEDGTKVEAVNPKTYVFEPSMSRGSEDDLIRTVNIPAMVKLHLHKRVQPPTQSYLQVVPKNKENLLLIPVLIKKKHWCASNCFI